ncbi:pimeloyl-ACP methyl ester esterase BioH [Candidatus Endoriftia persephone]|jgi:pimeloyl-[acyl-carrier protein] methyl ester esterase|uniref:Pimeloyl-[acyl-carrier protein] methyl ester esterase n=3 Tax=Gammaproteobacteria TaxID=1236 RepID=G2FAZ8_9GAMM|nr:pimeloyl-ACP methyl ester esterase BioH [Candidatus Endoriftia persephone]EGW55936.1 carboxylesterase BioH [endosymbiont of Tevnia jerichonana (vent Tica)]USF88071.1 pimeloyl-ACP methyl ester esterase BioH [Candidatus Endoriftia persephone]
MRLHVEQLGSGPDLLLLHGWGMNRAVWSGFAERLAVSYRVSLVDLPGHGQSPWGGRSALADWVDAVLAVAPLRAIWCGWSLGGQLALRAALDAPERVVSLLGIAATPRFAAAEAWPCAMEPRTLDQFIANLQRDHRKTLERFLALQVRGSEASREQLRLLRSRLAELPDPHPEALQAGLALLKSVDLRAELAALEVPNGWLFGERDTLVPEAAAQGLAELQPGAAVGVIPGAAHAPFLSHPDATLGLLQALLKAAR